MFPLEPGRLERVLVLGLGLRARLAQQEPEVQLAPEVLLVLARALQRQPEVPQVRVAVAAERALALELEEALQERQALDLTTAVVAVALLASLSA